MQWWCSKFRLENSRRQFMILLLLAGFAAALVPIPVSLVRSEQSKDRTEPFPCQDRPCACRSAAQCKKQCCCFTTEQKQAWGRRNGVKAFAGRFHQRDSSKSHFESPDSRPSPLSERLACCEHIPAVSSVLTREHPSAPPKAMSQSGKASSDPSRVKLIIGLFAQRCQGVSHTLAGIPIYIVPPRVELVTLVAQTSECVVLESVLFQQRNVDPPVPPPRLCSGTVL